MFRIPNIIVALLLTCGFNAIAQAASWQSSVDLEGIRLCVRGKNAADDYVAEATFKVTTPKSKVLSGSVWVHGDAWTCISFPEQFNKPGPARMEYLSGSFKWSATVENAVVRSGEFSFSGP
jgi:hypothetical protein